MASSTVLPALPESSLLPRLGPRAGAPTPAHPTAPLSVVRDQRYLQRRQGARRKLMAPIDTGQVSTLSVGERGNTTPTVQLGLRQTGPGLSRTDGKRAVPQQASLGQARTSAQPTFCQHQALLLPWAPQSLFTNAVPTGFLEGRALTLSTWRQSGVIRLALGQRERGETQGSP